MGARLVESRSTVYWLLGVAAIGLAVLAVRTRDRRYVHGLGGVAALLALFFLVNLLRKETDGEQIERKVKEMAAAVRAKELDHAFDHVSPRFRRGATDRAALRGFVQNALDRHESADFRVSRFERVRFSQSTGDGPKIGTITFRLKIIADERVIPFRVEADFVCDADGQWRLKDFRPYLFNGTDPYPVPGADG